MRRGQEEEFEDDHGQSGLNNQLGERGKQFTPGIDSHNTNIVEELNDVEFMCDDGKPLQFIKYDKGSGKFQVMPEAVAVVLCLLRFLMKSKAMQASVVLQASIGLEKAFCSTSYYVSKDMASESTRR